MYFRTKLREALCAAAEVGVVGMRVGADLLEKWLVEAGWFHTEEEEQEEGPSQECGCPRCRQRRKEMLS